MRRTGVKLYRAALALGLALLLGEAAVADAGGRGGGRGGGGHGFHAGKGGGSRGGFQGHHGGQFHGPRHHGFQHHGSRHHGFHHHGFGSKVFIGAAPFFLWGPSYLYTPPPVVAAPVYVQPNGYWYYCPSAQAYYPYVAACPEPWVPVPAR
jgi:hypothetical protein